MAGADPLQEAARDFGRRVANLLNRTVASGVVLGALIDTRNGACRVGKGLSKNNFHIQPIELLPGPDGAQVHLIVSHVLRWDDAGKYLASVGSAFRLYTDAEMTSPLVRYEYERENQHHPEAHIHMHSSWDAAVPLLGVRPPRKLHLPVGGRRFRPSLEDLIEFLVRENFSSPKKAWEVAIRDHREEWYRTQLSAAVRADPDIAITQLREDGRI